MADKKPRARALVARADSVAGLQVENLEKVYEDRPVGIFGWIYLPDGDQYVLLELFEDGEGELIEESATRWGINVEAGVLTVSAWRDSQDRHHGRPSAVLVLAQGGWSRFVTNVPYLDEDIVEAEEG